MKQYAHFILFILLSSLPTSLTYGQSLEEKESLISNNKWTLRGSFFKSNTANATDKVFISDVRECEKDNWLFFT